MQQTWSIEIFPREQYGVEGPYDFAKVLKRDAYHLTYQDGIYIINWSMICICSIIPTKDGTLKEIERLIWRSQP
jgi:hypothetical protein